MVNFLYSSVINLRCCGIRRRIPFIKFMTADFSNQQMVSKNRTTVYSGIQPTGIPHLGNYLGAIKNWVSSQNSHTDMYLSIVDMHSLTVPQDPIILRQNIRDMASSLIASGIDPKAVVLHQQSKVPQHFELMWILSCFTKMGRLNRMTQYKDKMKGTTQPRLGLFIYPVLMAADVLLYKTNRVPVGEDQLQHLELTVDLAREFNQRFCNMTKPYFPIPSPTIGSSMRVKSLRSPSLKMSKSSTNDKSRINLSDSPDEIRMKLRKAVTDCTSTIGYNPDLRPGVSNLIAIEAGLRDIDCEEVVEEISLMCLDTLGYKERLAEIIISTLAPIRSEFLRLRSEPVYIDHVLLEGSQRAEATARMTMNDVRSLVGIS